tara:strand:+ start:16570 stop:18573 length:2004 start_codon:yes stop_codon:yes gene_type:complete
MKTKNKSSILTLLALFGILFVSSEVIAQELKIVVSPNPINLNVGEELQIKGTVVDANGKALPDTVMFFTRARKALSVTREGMIKAVKPGVYSVTAMNIAEREARIRTSFEVNVAFPPIAKVEIKGVPNNIYSKTTSELEIVITDEAGLVRENPDVKYSSSNNDVVTFEHGKLMAKKTGKFTITAQSESKKATFKGEVKENPTANVEIANKKTVARTGDVINFDAKVMDRKGAELTDVPLVYSFVAQPDDALGNAAPGQVSQNGKFVANKAGLFTLMVKAGGVFAEQIIRVEPRNVEKDVEYVGRGAVLDIHTSDLWIWEGVDGRDYAVTGTWGANGDAYFWDVTDPANIVGIDTVHVDARTVNDVKVSEDGRVAVLTREGASDRKNGIVLLDVSNPRNVTVLSEYNEGLTGGVHNAFIYKNHVYAVNNGRRYDIINIDDPKNPKTVSRFELETEGHSIHDVWIEDGIAYSSNWSDGVVAVDIGSNTSADMPGAGGSPENPVQLGSYSYPSGWNHAAFPFKSKSTGDFYIAAGDESFPFGLPSRTNPVGARGWIHFVKFDGWDSPDEVARYQVPEAGTHNFWIVDDIMFVAYYNAGVRIVDISGELMGNLYDQGREIARFEPNDPDAIVPNAPFTWGPQPYKGHIFISDWNSGLWAIKLVDKPVTGTN